MSTFFTTPASQRKRKRVVRDDDHDARRRKGGGAARPTKSSRTSRGDIAADSDDQDDEDAESSEDGNISSHTAAEESSSSDDEDEDAAGRRTRLAERYLENTRNQVLAEGFDAEDIDKEILAERMGERLNEDTAESKGKLYRWIAEDYDIHGALRAQFRSDANVVTAVAVCYPHIYTVAKDSSLVKWEVSMPTGADSERPQRISKPKKLKSTRGSKTQDARGNIEQHKGPILCVAASDDGKFVVTGGQDRTMIVWDATDLKPLRVFPQHRDSVVALAFRKGTNQLFSASKDRTIKIWSMNELAYIESLFGHQDAILDIDALFQETCVSVGARDKSARFWRVVEETQLVFRGGGTHGGKQPHHESTQGSKGTTIKKYGEGSIERVAMIDNDTFVTGSDNGSLSLWSLQKKKAVHTLTLAHGLQRRNSPEEASAELNPSPDRATDPEPRYITAMVAVPLSNMFFTGSWDGYVRAWKITEDKRRIEPVGPLGVLDVEMMTNGDVGHEQIQADEATEPVPVKGVINDLALFERGDRGRDGLYVVAAVGKEHRLGRWLKVPGARNQAVMFHLPRISTATMATE